MTATSCHRDVAMRLGCLCDTVMLILEDVSRGEPNHQIARMRNDIGVTLMDLGQHAEAEALLLSARDMWRELNGPTHEHVGTAAINLAYCLETQGRLAEAELEAEAAFRASLQVLQRRYPDGNPATAHVLDSLWHLLAELRRQPEAIPLLQQEVDLQRRFLPADNPELFSLLLELGSMQSRAGQFAGAEASLRELLSRLQQREPDSWAPAQVMSLLGVALDRQGKHEEAERMLLQGYEKIPSAPNLMPNKRAALVRLIKHYDDRGRTEDAARWRKLLEPASDGKDE